VYWESFRQLIKIIIEQKRYKKSAIQNIKENIFFLSNRVANPTREPGILKKAHSRTESAETLDSTASTHFRGDSGRSHQITIPAAFRHGGGLRDRKLVRSYELDRDSVYHVYNKAIY